MADPSRRSGGGDEPDGVVDDGRVDVDLRDAVPHPDQVFRGQHHLRRTRRQQSPPDDRVLLRRGRITHEHLHHESVDLRLGQRIGAVGLDRVLGRHHQERLRYGNVSRPMVTCRSCITSSNALCTLAGARLISSASSRLVNTGPSETSNSPVRWW